MADLIHIWKPPEFPYELHNKLLAIMETLEVCCRTRESVLLPSLLPDKPLTTSAFPELLYHPAMTRVYVFDFVPFGFLSRILVRLMRTLSCSHFWKSGTYIFPKKVKECGAVGRITIKNHIMEIKVTIPLDAHILLAEADLTRLIREVDDPENNFPKLKKLLSAETFYPEKLIRLLEKRQINSPTSTAMEELEVMFTKLRAVAEKYESSLLSPNPMIDRRDISKAFSTVLRNCIKTMRKTVSDCGVTGTVGLTTLTSDIDAIHMLRVVLENVEALVKWYNAQLSILVPCVDCIMKEQSQQPHMFFVHQLEEAYVQKSVVTATHETAIVCPAGHKKAILCADGEYRSVVPLSRLAPDITMNDTYKFIVPFSKLEMFGELGRGSYGKVMRAKFKDFEVAVKQMLTYDINDPNLDDNQKKAVLQGYQDFRHEAWIMSSLSHPHIVKMYGVCLYPLCMVTEFVPNGDLFKFLQTEKEIDWKFKLKMALDIAKGMQYLHSISPPLIHRDLKSPNVLMASFDPKAEVNCKVADFGLTRILTTNLKSDEFYNPRWLAPEVMTGDDYTEKVDVFSLGIILWEILTQERPHENVKFDRQIEDAVLSGARLPIPENCPIDYKELMSECWQQNPATRPSCSNVAHAIDKMLSELIDERRKSPDHWSSGTIRRNHSGSILEKKKRSNGFESTGTLRSEGSLVFEYKMDAAEPEHTSIPKIICKPEDLNLQMLQKIEMEECPQYMIFLEKFSQVWVGRYDGVIAVYSSKNFRQIDFWPAHTSRVNALLRVGDNVWSCADDGSVCMWEAKNFCLSAKAQFPHQILCMCAYNTEILCGASDGTISRWDRGQVSKLQMLGSININGPVCSILADDRGKVWIGSESEIHVISGMTYKLVKSWKAHQKAIKCLYQIGEYVWSASDDMRIGVWNVATMTLSKMIAHHTGRVLSLAYVNNHVWSGSFDKSFVLWDAEKQKAECLGGIERHADTVRAIVIVRDTVWVASLDRSISIWKYVKSASKVRKGLASILSKSG
eukprot:Phypoly_transcript_01263.p1 GENE.Phypoly_transcript_01263~~Phypoly_transcript_01263.p1  ORF type:complete len:1153 (+),score=139.74 Phypoly_transcript_01263:409-3459(+)